MAWIYSFWFFYLNKRGRGNESHLSFMGSLRIKPALILRSETVQFDTPALLGHFFIRALSWIDSVMWLQPLEIQYSTSTHKDRDEEESRLCEANSAEVAAEVQSGGCYCVLEPPAWKLLAVWDNTFLCIQGILICPIPALTFSAKEH